MHQLKIQNLSCERQERYLFMDLDFTVSSGEFFQVIGPNGSGKSSLLRIMAGLLTPTKGRVVWQSNGPHPVQYLGHLNGIKGALTVAENIHFSAGLNGCDEYNRDDVLKYFSLEHVSSELAKSLSAGQQHRLALTRLLLGYSPLWILDEPFTALDQWCIKTLEHLFKQHCEKGGLIVLTSHQPLGLKTSATLKLGAS